MSIKLVIVCAPPIQAILDNSTKYLRDLYIRLLTTTWLLHQPINRKVTLTAYYPIKSETVSRSPNGIKSMCVYLISALSDSIFNTCSNIWYFINIKLIYIQSPPVMFFSLGYLKIIKKIRWEIQSKTELHNQTECFWPLT